jgi:hypothetical protein
MRKSIKKKFKGGSGYSSFQNKVTKIIQSSKPASETRSKDISVLKNAIDQLKKLLEQCKTENKQLKEEKIVLLGWKYAMEKLTKKINQGNI